MFYEDLQDYPGGTNFAYSIYTNGNTLAQARIRPFHRLNL
jgi:hypothetical protein